MLGKCPMRNVVCANARFAVNNDRQSVTATHSNLPGLIAWFIGSLQPYNEDRKRVVCNVVRMALFQTRQLPIVTNKNPAGERRGFASFSKDVRLDRYLQVFGGAERH